MNKILCLAKWRRITSYLMLAFLVLFISAISPFLFGLSKTMPPEAARTMRYAIYFGFGITALSVALIIIIIKQIKLVVSDKGLRYSQLGYVIEAEWADIQHTTDKWAGIGIYSGVIVPSKCFKAGFLTTMCARVFRLDTLIPLSIFSARWREDDIGKMIRENAPRVINEERT